MSTAKYLEAGGSLLSLNNNVIEVRSLRSIDTVTTLATHKGLGADQSMSLDVSPVPNDAAAAYTNCGFAAIRFLFARFHKSWPRNFWII